jgi:hypothetical protein
MILAISLVFCGPVSASTIFFQDDFQSDAAGTFKDGGSALTNTFHPAIGADDIGGSWVVTDTHAAGEAFTGLQVWNNVSPTTNDWPDCASGANNYVTMARYRDGTEGNMKATGWNAAATTNTQVELQFSLYKGANGEPISAFIGGFGDQNYGNRAFGVYVTPDGTVNYYDETAETFLAAGLSMPLDSWQDLELNIDTSSRTFTLTIGATTSGTLNWTGAATGFQYVYFENSAGADNRFAVDNVKFTTSAIPEPSVLALLTTGLVGLSAYAWRKRK